MSLETILRDTELLLEELDRLQRENKQLEDEVLELRQLEVEDPAVAPLRPGDLYVYPKLERAATEALARRTSTPSLPADQAAKASALITLLVTWFGDAWTSEARVSRPLMEFLMKWHDVRPQMDPDMARQVTSWKTAPTPLSSPAHRWSMDPSSDAVWSTADQLFNLITEAMQYVRSSEPMNWEHVVPPEVVVGWFNPMGWLYPNTLLSHIRDDPDPGFLESHRTYLSHWFSRSICGGPPRALLIADATSSVELCYAYRMYFFHLWKRASVSGLGFQSNTTEVGGRWLERPMERRAGWK